MTWIEKMSPNNPKHTESESYGNNCDKSSRDSDKVGDEEQESDNLKSLK